MAAGRLFLLFLVLVPSDGQEIGGIRTDLAHLDGQFNR